MSRRGVAAAALAAIVLLAGTSAVAAAPPRPTALDWGGRFFVEVASFKQWLRERHASYARWGQKHPAALATLESATAIPKPLKPGDLPPASAGCIAGGGAGLDAGPQASRPVALELLLLAAAAVLLGLAAAPGARLPVAGRAADALVVIRPHRLVLAAAGMSVLAALLLVRLAS